MKKFITILAIALSCSATALAQSHSGGVKAKVVDRAARTPIPGVHVTLSQRSGDFVAETTTGTSGEFLLSNVADGNYVLGFSADGYTDITVNAAVERGFVRDLVMVTMTRDRIVSEVDDSSFSMFDNSGDSMQDSPTIIYSTYDPFTSAAGYGFSSVRFKGRGYDSDLQQVYVAGIPMNDAVTGYSPYSLWTGLNEAFRSRNVTIGQEISDVSSGGINGVTNFAAVPSAVRPGWRFGVLSNGALYRARLMMNYASGQMDNGWSFAVNASMRIGGNDWVKGVYYRSASVYAGAEKKFNDAHRLAFFAFFTPGERGSQNASTQEVYDLMKDNMYNSNWGYQNGKVRNARVKRSMEPVFGLKYEFNPSYKLNVNVSTIFRTGHNGSTALDWYEAQDPRPDYYRNLPSYFSMDTAEESEEYGRQNKDKSEWAEYAWTCRDGSCNKFQHVNWDGMYQVNYNQVKYSDGRSKYTVQERRTAQNDFNLAGNARWKAADFFTLRGGLSGRVNRTEFYGRMDDLLGGSYFLNVDQFAERDFAFNPALIQNDLDYYVAHGEAQKIGVGDKYSYDYYAHVLQGKGWASGQFSFGAFSADLAGHVGYRTFWREGLVRKGLFAGLDDSGNPFYTRPDGSVYATKTPAEGDILTTAYDKDGTVITSKGKSATAQFVTYSVKAALQYVFKGGHRVYANVGYYNDAPNFNQAFVSARTRNTMVGNLDLVKTFSGDINYAFNNYGVSARVTAFYTTIKDKTKVSSFYDDSQQSFTNFAMSGINERHCGVELGVSFPLGVRGLTGRAVVSYGDYIYTSNPHLVQTVDNSQEVVRDEDVTYWKSSPIFKKVRNSNGVLEFDEDINGNPIVIGEEKHRIASTPQLATQLSINYNVNYWFIELSGQYFDMAYLDMNPLYRTTFACQGGDGIATPEEIEYMTHQERFPGKFLLNASVGKSWKIQHKYTLGFSFEIKNILNDTNVKIGGYEQTRLIKNSDNTRYYRFDPKYFYMPGANYMFNIYLNF